jgi:hypothetical protein
MSFEIRVFLSFFLFWAFQVQLCEQIEFLDMRRLSNVILICAWVHPQSKREREREREREKLVRIFKPGGRIEVGSIAVNNTRFSFFRFLVAVSTTPPPSSLPKLESIIRHDVCSLNSSFPSSPTISNFLFFCSCSSLQKKTTNSFSCAVPAT